MFYAIAFQRFATSLSKWKFNQESKRKCNENGEINQTEKKNSQKNCKLKGH